MEIFRQREEQPLYQNSSIQSDHNDLDMHGNTSHEHSMSSFLRVDKLRRKLKYHFMNPREKFQAKKRIQCKLILQLIKIILVTIQVCLFGNEVSRHLTFLDTNVVSFHHLYLEGWDASFETPAYPPAHGVFAVYTFEELYAKVDYACQRYMDTPSLALGSYDFAANPMPPVQMCRYFYINGTIDASNQSYTYDGRKRFECMDIEPVLMNTTEGPKYQYNIQRFLELKKMELNFDRLLVLSVKFTVKSVNVNSVDIDKMPDCYRFDIMIIFDNQIHHGQIPVTLTSTVTQLSCHGEFSHLGSSEYFIKTAYTSLDVIIIVVTLFSCFLCVRSLINTVFLYKQTVTFFKSFHSITLSLEDSIDFINLWYIIIVLSDLCSVIGSILKIITERADVNYYDPSSMLLGTSAFFVWIGVLRYVSFYAKYSVLINTIKRCFFGILRYLVCVMLAFAAFAFYGWVVFGPKHIKFRTLFSTTETLFSLTNGDDMYATFSLLDNSTMLLFCLFRAYLYGFIFLFVFLVMNLCLTIILEGYSAVISGAQRDSHLLDFISQCKDLSTSSSFLLDDIEDEDSCNLGRFGSDYCKKFFCCCCTKKRSDLYTEIVDDRPPFSQSLLPM